MKLLNTKQLGSIYAGDLSQYVVEWVPVKSRGHAYFLRDRLTDHLPEINQTDQMVSADFYLGKDGREYAYFSIEGKPFRADVFIRAISTTQQLH